MILDNWLQLSFNNDIISKIESDPYAVAYKSLNSGFFDKIEIDWDSLIVALHIVYGWMPTIPKLDKTFSLNETEKSILLKYVKDIKNDTLLSDEMLPLSIIKTFCNNSIVGGSKLLHFINPNSIPIWDRRVAKVFLIDGKQWNVNNIDHFLLYKNTLNHWLLEDRLKERCLAIQSSVPILKSCSRMRIIEIFLFHAL